MSREIDSTRLPNRQSIRLPDYDYSQNGAYFITICTWNQKSMFGDIAGCEMCLNETGVIVSRQWNMLPERNTHVLIDEWIVMPNHLHGIVILTDAIRNTQGSDENNVMPKIRKGIGRIIGAFKTASTNAINEYFNGTTRKIWQRNYYERIIRNEKEHENIRCYILENPARWAVDKGNSE
jgi:putative transposase